MTAPEGRDPVTGIDPTGLDRLPELVASLAVRLGRRARTLLAEVESDAGPRGGLADPLAVDEADLAAVLDAVVDELGGPAEYPFGAPSYAGQMLKPPHPVARLAYALAQFVNPNAHALDGGPAASRLEKRAVAHLAAMCGWQDGHLGHLTGGGTIANLEALWVGAELRGRGARVYASDQAHYTHARLSAVLGLPFTGVPSDLHGALDAAALEDLLARDVARGETPGTVVATLGTTGNGAVDPLPGLLALRDRFGFRLHADAAYGGYFRLVTDTLGAPERAAFERLDAVDSVAIDPHKHGLQPYGCGAVLFRDPSVGAVYKHDSPYTYFSSDELHLGEISLECSRAGAAAVALWATQQLFPCTPDGRFAEGLRGCLRAARRFHEHLADDPARWRTTGAPALDIVVWAPRGPGPEASAVSAASRRLFDLAAAEGVHLALMRLPAGGRVRDLPDFGDLVWDQDHVTCLRSVLMKPEHEAAVRGLADRLDGLADRVLREAVP